MGRDLGEAKAQRPEATRLNRDTLVDGARSVEENGLKRHLPGGSNSLRTRPPKSAPAAPGSLDARRDVG